MFIMVGRKAVYEAFFVRSGPNEEKHEDALEDFEEWLSMRVEGTPADEVFSPQKSTGTRDLYLVYQFEQMKGTYLEVCRLKNEELIDLGQRYDELVVHLGKQIGTHCLDCGAKKKQLHLLGCRFEQCANCEELLASCLCGLGDQLPFGWEMTDKGPVPMDDVRVPYGDENYPLRLIQMFDGKFGVSS